MHHHNDRVTTYSAENSTPASSAIASAPQREAFWLLRCAPPKTNAPMTIGSPGAQRVLDKSQQDASEHDLLGDRSHQAGRDQCRDDRVGRVHADHSIAADGEQNADNQDAQSGPEQQAPAEPADPTHVQLNRTPLLDPQQHQVGEHGHHELGQPDQRPVLRRGLRHDGESGRGPPPARSPR